MNGCCIKHISRRTTWMQFLPDSIALPSEVLKSPCFLRGIQHRQILHSMPFYQIFGLSDVSKIQKLRNLKIPMFGFSSHSEIRFPKIWISGSPKIRLCRPLSSCLNLHIARPLHRPLHRPLLVGPLLCLCFVGSPFRLTASAHSISSRMTHRLTAASRLAPTLC